jgi:hypothetical protein
MTRLRSPRTPRGRAQPLAHFGRAVLVFVSSGSGWVLASRASASAAKPWVGQLQDAGNTTTLAHYLSLLEQAFLVSGLEKFASGKGRARGSSPKLVLWNNALMNAVALRSPEEARADGSHWGRIVENAVGAHLLNHAGDGGYEVSWWRERDDEVDFVVAGGGRRVGDRSQERSTPTARDARFLDPFSPTRVRCSECERGPESESGRNPSCVVKRSPSPSALGPRVSWVSHLRGGEPARGPRCRTRKPPSCTEFAAQGAQMGQRGAGPVSACAG